MKLLKYLLPFLLVCQVALAGHLQNSDFATPGYLTGAGGTIAQLLNDTNIYSPALSEQYSTALAAGDIANFAVAFNMQQLATPAAPAAGFNKLYFKGDGNLYAEDSGATEFLINTPGGGWSLVGNAGTTGANFLGTTDAQDLLFRTNNAQRMSIASTGEINATMTYNIPADGTPGVQKDYNFESEFNAVSSNTDRDIYHMAIDSHFDRSHSGSNANNVNGLSNSATVEGSGTIANHTAFTMNQTFQGNGGGATTNGRSFTIGAGTAPLYTLNNYSAISTNFFGDPASTIDNISELGMGSSANITNNYLGFNLNHAGTIGGSYTGVVATENGAITGNATSFSSGQTGNVTGSFSGINLFKDGDASNFSGINITHVSGNISGGAEGVRVGFSPGTYTGKFAFTAVMNDGATSGSGRFFEGGWGNGSYNDRIGFNINGGTGNTTTSDTGLNVGQSSGTSGNFAAVNITGSGVTGSYRGVEIQPSGGTATNVTGIDVDLSALSTPGQQKQGLRLNDGALTVNGGYDTSLLPPSPFFANINNISGNYIVALGFPVAASAMVANNLTANGLFHDNMGPDGLGGLVGFTSVGYLPNISVDAGKTVDTVNITLAGSGVQAGSGAVTNANVFSAAGFINFGGTLAITNLSAFHALASLCSMGTNCWGVKIDDAAADNSFAKDVVVGSAAPTNVSSGLELNSTTKAILNSRMTTAQRNILTAVNGMQIYNTTTDTFDCYAAGVWGACASAGSGTVTSVSVVAANGFDGTVATATTTPAITIKTTITAPVLKGNGTAILAATPGVDYQAAPIANPQVANYTAVANDVVLADATGGAFTVTLPLAAANTNMFIRIKKMDVSANTVSITASGADVIDGQATQNLVSQYQSVTLFSDGTNWDAL